MKKYVIPIGVLVVMLIIAGAAKYFMSSSKAPDEASGPPLIETLQAQSPADQLKIASNPKSDISKLATIALVENPDVKRALLRNPKVPAAALNILASDKDESIRLTVARHPGTQPNILEFLAKDQSPRVKAAVYLNTYTDQLTKDQIKGDHSPLIKALTAGSPAEIGKLVATLDTAPDAELIEEGLALNPSTTSDVLNQLISTTKDFKVFISIIENDASNAEELQTIYAKIKSSQFSEMDQMLARDAFAKNPNTPAAILAEILAASTQENWIAASIAEHPNATSEMLAIFAKSDDISIRMGLAKRTTIPLELADTLTGDSEMLVRYELAQNPGTPINILQKLAQDSDSVVRAAVAENPSTTLEILTILAKDSELSVRYAVATNPHATAELIAELAKDKELDFLKYEAQKKDTLANSADKPDDQTTKNLIQAIENEEVGYLSSVASNYNTSPLILSILTKNKNSEVQSRAGGNIKTPTESLYGLLGSSNTNVRTSLVMGSCSFKGDLNSASTYIRPNRKSIVWILSKDLNIELRKVVISICGTEELLKLMLEDPSDLVRSINPLLSSNQLFDLAHSPNLEVRMNVARNRNTDLKTLQILMSESELWPSIATRKNLSSDIIDMLISHGDENTQCALAENYDVPPNVVSATLSEFPNSESCSNAAFRYMQAHTAIGKIDRKFAPDVFDKLLVSKSKLFIAEQCSNSDIIERLAKDNDEQVRAHIASNPNTTTDILDLLASDIDRGVRYAVAVHPKTSDDALEKLASDPDPLVASGAKANLAKR